MREKVARKNRHLVCPSQVNAEVAKINFTLHHHFAAHMQVKASCQMDVGISWWSLQPKNRFPPPVWVCEEEKGDNQQVKRNCGSAGQKAVVLVLRRESLRILWPRRLG